MSTVKISELPVISQINANTANTIFVGLDIPTNVTGRMTLTTLAEGLYSNNNLVVGNTNIVLPNAVAQMTGTSTDYVQVSLQNLSGNGSGDIVVTADNGTDTTHFIDLGMTGSTYTYPGYTVMNKNDGYLLVVGDTSSTQGGNLTIGTVTEGKDITFFQGGAETANAIAQFKYNTGLKLLKKPLIFADGTSQNTAVDYATVNSRITANVATINGSITANAASANSVIDSRITANVATINGSITSNITTANVFAQAAFNKANNALANTSGIFGGNLTVSGNLTASANLVSFVGSATPATNALVEIIGSVGGSQVTPASDGYMLHVTGKDGLSNRIIFDSFGTGAYPLVAGRSARGSANTPLATQNTDVLMRVSSGGYGDTGFTPLGSGRMDFVAVENFTDTNRGTEIQFWNTIPGTNTLNKIVTMNASHTEVSGYIKPLKGFIWIPRTFASAQTAVTIDFSTDAVIKVDITNDATVSFSNHLAGKIVDVWVTNTSGAQHVFTHGATATNSTVNSTTYTIPATSTVMLKYFCIDSTSANVCVAVIHG